MPVDPADIPPPPIASPAEFGFGGPAQPPRPGMSIKAVVILVAGLSVVMVIGTAFLDGTGAASASTSSLHSRWLVAARVTTHTPEYRRFCVQHRGNDHYWREGFCHGDLQNYPDYGQLSAPPGYHVCYVRDAVRVGEAARIALSHGVHPQRHLRGC